MANCTRYLRYKAKAGIVKPSGEVHLPVSASAYSMGYDLTFLKLNKVLERQQKLKITKDPDMFVDMVPKKMPKNNSMYKSFISNKLNLPPRSQFLPAIARRRALVWIQMD